MVFAHGYSLQPCLIAAVVSALSALKTVDLDLLKDAHRVPPSLREEDSLKQLIQKCELKLVKIFGDVPSVIVDAGQRGSFLELPHAAVLSWLKADNLKVHSESCVVLLLAAWVKANEGSTSSEDLKQFAQNIRVKHLSPSYLHGILLDLPWFMSSLEKGGIAFLRGIQAAGRSFSGMFGWSSPGAWISKPCLRTTQIPTTTIILTVGPEQLAEMESGKCCESEDVYHDGVFRFLQFKKRRMMEDVCWASTFAPAHTKHALNFQSISAALSDWAMGHLQSQVNLICL